MRISDWSSDVCSSDLLERISQGAEDGDREIALAGLDLGQVALADAQVPGQVRLLQATVLAPGPDGVRTVDDRVHDLRRSEERRVGKECVSTCSSRWSPYP